ncbi:MAG: M20/M25/M40 family metallo-hydrolase [Thermodesulfobacteriota bacterium]
MEPRDILTRLAVPRPNHSPAVDRTAAYIKELLSSWGLVHTQQVFPLHPHKMFLTGLAVLLLAAGFFVAVLATRPALSLAAALSIPILLILEVELFVPLVSRLVTRTGENIIASFTVPEAARELLFSAHYDSKTDFFDHVQRARIYRFIPAVLGLGLFICLWLFLAAQYQGLAAEWLVALARILAAATLVFWGLIFLAFGGYVFLPAARQSPGAVDNATAVVSLLALARDIKENKVRLGRSNVTLIFFGGEEVGPQGARCYVRQRFGRDEPRGPVSLVNLELAAQNGAMIHWRRSGVFIKYRPADPGLIQRLNQACLEITGAGLETEDKITDDSLHFLAAGVPAVTIGHAGRPGLGPAGFHSVRDNLDRVNLDNLRAMIAVLERYIEDYNRS